jgi:putative transposase
MYLQGVSTRKVAAITEGLSRVRIGKDAVSRVAQRLEEELSAWRGRPLELAGCGPSRLDAHFDVG